MFCPECKSEFVEGVYLCPDCRKELVEKLPEKPVPAFVDYKELLATYNPADIAFLKSLLESLGIQYFFKGEHFMYMRPLADPARLMVRADQAGEAAELLKDLDLAYTGIHLDKKGAEEPG